MRLGWRDALGQHQSDLRQLYRKRLLVEAEELGGADKRGRTHGAAGALAEALVDLRQDLHLEVHQFAIRDVQEVPAAARRIENPKRQQRVGEVAQLFQG